LIRSFAVTDELVLSCLLSLLRSKPRKMSGIRPRMQNLVDVWQRGPGRGSAKGAILGALLVLSFFVLFFGKKTSNTSPFVSVASAYLRSCQSPFLSRRFPDIISLAHLVLPSPVSLLIIPF